MSPMIQRFVSSIVLWLPFMSMGYTNDPETQAQIKQLIQHVRPAFVFFGQGSGAVISRDGLVLTNSHVLLGDEEEFSVRTGDGRSYTARVLGRDPLGDLALLKLVDARKLTYLPLADARTVRPGQICLAFGNPFAVGLVDQNPSITMGVVSALHQVNGRYTDSIVTDVPINPGNSGGPLINLKGELVGINGMIKPSLGLRSNTGLAYAIPTNQIELWIPRLKVAGGRNVYHGALHGIRYVRDVAFQGTGAKVSRVIESMAADQFGFKPGDVVVEVNGDPVWNVQRLMGIIGTYPAGSEMRLRLHRGEEKAEVMLRFMLPENRPGNLAFSLASPSPRDKYLRVSKVEKGSTAEEAGLRAGDEILAVQNQELTDSPSLQYLLLQGWMVTLRQNSTILLRIRREIGKDQYEEHEIRYVAR